ncbi:response regulator [bacterium]|nr:response regulator [bacterium]
MKLQNKISALVLSLVFFLTLILFVLVQSKLSVEFREIETDLAQKNTKRVVDAMQNMVDTLYANQGDWSLWDDTFYFIQNHNQAYIDSNLTDASIATTGVDFMLFVNLQGKVIHHKSINHENRTETATPDFILKLVSPEYGMLNFKDTQDHHQGVITLNDTFYVISAQPVLLSSGEGDSGGTLIWGYKLGNSVINKINDITHNKFSILLSDKLDKTISQDLQNKSIVSRIIDDNAYYTYTYFPNYKGDHEYYIETRLERPLYNQYIKTIKAIGFGLCTVAFLFGLILISTIHKTVTRPLLDLGMDLESITLSQNTSLRLTKASDDEIGKIRTTINSMLDAIDQSREKISSIQEQLYQSQKMESIGKLAGGIAHDFNNLLGGILGYASLLKEQLTDNEKAQKRLAVISSSAQRGAQLTRELLAFARKGAYEKTVLNLNTLINQTIEILQSTVGKNVTIHKNLDDQLLNVEGDSTQLSQIIMNLGINARDAMNDVGNIFFTTKNILFTTDQPQLKLKAGQYIELTCEDTGPGINDALREKIFEPFFTTKPSGKGTGLGLSMIMGIVQSHEGQTILAPYIQGKGATFVIYLPATLKSAQNADEPDSLVLDDNIHFTNKSILVVDDETHIRSFLNDVLSEYGAIIIEASNGNEALTLLKDPKSNFDLIIMDIIMPGISGIETFYEIQKFNKTTPVMMASGYTDNADLVKLRADKKVSFMQKPFSKKELINTVNEILFRKI